MKAKLVLTATAALLFGAGLLLSFLPQEVAAALGLANTPMAVLLLQVLSAALLGMGYLNWLSRCKPMGGIYSRPLALQNLLFFGVGAVALDRAAFRGAVPLAIQMSAFVFTVLAAAFGWLMFFHDPVPKVQSKE